ncbi:hypothetical protein [Zooshikella sp. RANM57]|uniref:hypothetical protein n=1 Tax=Zooshikella sp. RANM57 TaxID=3425863 RepID=UPI003D6DE760
MNNLRVKETNTYDLTLHEIFFIVTKRFKFVLGVTLICVFISSVYIIFRVPVYEVKVALGKPLESQIMELKKSGIFPISVDKVFKDTKKYLINNVFLDEFYNNNKSLFLDLKGDDEIGINFDVLMSVAKNIKIDDLSNEKEALDALSVKFIHDEKINGSLLLNNYIDFIIDKQKNIYVREFEELKKFKLNEIKNDFYAKTKKYFVDKAASLERLSEAIKVAKKVGIKDPYDNTMSEYSKEKNTILKAEINNQNKPLYFRGYRALAAEKKAMTQRSKESLFIPGVSEYEEKINYYNKTEINQSKIQLIGWKKKAVESKNPINISNTLIYILTVVLGICVGVCLAVLSYLRKNNSNLQ